MESMIDWFKQSRSLGFVALALSCFGAALLAVFVIAADSTSHIRPVKLQSGHTFDRRQFDKMLAEYPELFWLEGAEEGVSALPEVFACVRYFGKTSTSFDRAVKAIRALDLYIDGGYPDYLEFASVMPKECRLSWDNFLSSQQKIQVLLEDYPGFTKEEVIQVLKTCIVISEMNYSKTLRAKAWVYEIFIDDEIDLLDKVIETHPEIFPSFAILNLKQKKLISSLMQTISLDRLFYFTSVYKIMGDLDRDGIVKKDPDLFELICFLHQCRISARDVISDRVSFSGFNERVFSHLQLFRKANYVVAKSSLQAGYEYYLCNRSQWLGFGLSTPLDRTLTFLGSFLNCYTSAEGDLLKEAFLDLHPKDISFLVNEFEDLATVNDDSYRYMSCVLYNLKMNPQLGRSSQERLSNAISMGIPFFSKLVFLNQSTKHGKSVPLNFIDVASTAIEEPYLLKHGKAIIGEDGKVSILRR